MRAREAKKGKKTECEGAFSLVYSNSLLCLLQLVLLFLSFSLLSLFLFSSLSLFFISLFFSLSFFSLSVSSLFSSSSCLSFSPIPQPYRFSTFHLPPVPRLKTSPTFSQLRPSSLGEWIFIIAKILSFWLFSIVFLCEPYILCLWPINEYQVSEKFFFLKGGILTAHVDRGETSNQQFCPSKCRTIVRQGNQSLACLNGFILGAVTGVPTGRGMPVTRPSHASPCRTPDWFFQKSVLKKQTSTFEWMISIAFVHIVTSK